ncbi:Transcription initiation factor TFIID subunit [Cryptosporidium felis]|nr:Transcription initiation factor TFIID subunit [Cryptosporidium felis]
MKPSLECKLRLKTNTYLPEIPTFWLDSGAFVDFDTVANRLRPHQKSASPDNPVESTNAGGGPIFTASFSKDGEIFAVANPEGIFLLGSITKTCFAAVPFSQLRAVLGLEESRILICTDIHIFDDRFLSACFGDFIGFWDLDLNKPWNFDCYIPLYIGSLTIEDLTEYIVGRWQLIEDLPRHYSAQFCLKDSPNASRFASLHAIRVLNTETKDDHPDLPQRTVNFELALELPLSLPLLVRLEAVYSVQPGVMAGSPIQRPQDAISIQSISLLLPDYILNLLTSGTEEEESLGSGSNTSNRLVSFSVLDDGNEFKLFSTLVKICETNFLFIFDKSKQIMGTKTTPSYSKRQSKYLNNCKSIFNKSGDILVIQYPDRFTVYSLEPFESFEAEDGGNSVESHSEESNHFNDSLGLEDSGTHDDSGEEGKLPKGFVSRLKIKLLYSYSQVIQKEWISSIAIFQESSKVSGGCYPQGLYGPVSKLYACGVLAVTSISSNGQALYYLFKVCSKSDERRYSEDPPNTPCRHCSNDNTGSNMIIWKMEVTKLNGIRKIVWQPGAPICLAMQFIVRLRNTKLMHDDFIEMNDLTEALAGGAENTSPFGAVFFLEPRTSNDDMLLWSRLMVGFTAIHRNREYIEREDEFDRKSEKEEGEFEPSCTRRTYFLPTEKFKSTKNRRDSLSPPDLGAGLENFSEDIRSYNNNLETNVVWMSASGKGPG